MIHAIAADEALKRRRTVHSLGTGHVHWSTDFLSLRSVSLSLMTPRSAQQGHAVLFSASIKLPFPVLGEIDLPTDRVAKTTVMRKDECIVPQWVACHRDHEILGFPY